MISSMGMPKSRSNVLQILDEPADGLINFEASAGVILPPYRTVTKSL